MALLRPSLASLATIWLILVSNLISSTAAANYPLTNDSRCDCYMTNGSDTANFTRHAFFDFRELEQYQGTPALLGGFQEASTAMTTSDFFLSEQWASMWEIQTWTNIGTANTTMRRVNSRNNVYIEQNTDERPSSKTWLSLRTARQADFQSTAEIVSRNKTYQYISMRMLARTVGSPGGCTAMFTYHADDQNRVQEVDLEVLTKYPKDQVQCTNQPALDANGDLIPEATANVTLPNGLHWTDWAVYRLDWTPKQSTWYVNGEQLTNISFQTPHEASRIHLNAWSDAGNWTGKMDVNTEAHLQVQWWEILFNSTSPDMQRQSCRRLCSVDETPVTGQPVKISQGSRLVNRSATLGTLVNWIPGLVVLALLVV
ncbi:uncharacterized protein E0L32_008981 [Thyridium curvatum]|uniref:GH16 domain-containing protein n=1 Tax=Thyridium curvatum TaxID=1093900 RepID=A0A507AZW0_9PEZI|nr:uncharacterized protein E0L32_008981 [Thyridium curvatum]TPX09790.1 hypothetical protein E0L32_008981 [Thyridium curvatum]